jgi:hypothetical protein
MDRNTAFTGLNVPSMIVMDNTSDHAEILNKTPTSNSKKAAIQNWLNTNNIPYEQEILKGELLEIVKNNRNEKE